MVFELVENIVGGSGMRWLEIVDGLWSLRL